MIEPKCPFCGSTKIEWYEKTTEATWSGVLSIKEDGLITTRLESSDTLDSTERLQCTICHNEIDPEDMGLEVSSWNCTYSQEA